MILIVHHRPRGQEKVIDETVLMSRCATRTFLRSCLFPMPKGRTVRLTRRSPLHSQLESVLEAGRDTSLLKAPRVANAHVTILKSFPFLVTHSSPISYSSLNAKTTRLSQYAKPDKTHIHWSS